MPSVIRKSPDLLGGRYFCVGATNRYLVSCRDSRKIVNIDSSNFGAVMSSVSVAANPGAVVYIAGTIYCIGEDGYLRSFTQTGDTLSAVVSTINVYTANSNWLWNISTTIVCPWGFDGIQLIVAGVVTAQRTSGLARIQNAYLNGSRLYCFDGNGKGVVMTIVGGTITQGEQFAIPSGTNVDCIGLISPTVLGVGANTNPQYITLSLTDPDLPVWASRTLTSAPIGAVTSSGALISTDLAPLSSDAGVYDVTGSSTSLLGTAVSVNGGVISDTGGEYRYICVDWIINSQTGGFESSVGISTQPALSTWVMNAAYTTLLPVTTSLQTISVTSSAIQYNSSGVVVGAPVSIATTYTTAIRVGSDVYWRMVIDARAAYLAMRGVDVTSALIKFNPMVSLAGGRDASSIVVNMSACNSSTGADVVAPPQCTHTFIGGLSGVFTPLNNGIYNGYIIAACPP